MAIEFILTTVLGGGGFLLYHWFRDRFASLNRFADSKIEDSLLRPLKLDWRTWGNPITWIHHTAWTALVSLMGGLVASFTGTPVSFGMFVWAVGFTFFYLVREGYGFYTDRGQDIGPMFKRVHPYTNRIVDGVMDVVGPASYTFWLWTLL